jgi:hypothetical protein
MALIHSIINFGVILVVMFVVLAILYEKYKRAKEGKPIFGEFEGKK